MSVTNALSAGFTRSMRASTARITSTGETFFRLMAAAIAEAGIQQELVVNHERLRTVSGSLMLDPSARLASGDGSPVRPCGRGRRRLFRIPLRAAQARVERVPERVAEEVRAEHGEADGDAGEQHQPGRLLRVLRGGDGQHAPHDGYGSGTPSPRNDSAASTRMALPSCAVPRTMNGPMVFGKMCRKAMRRCVSPMARAASMYCISRMESTLARITRAARGMIGMEYLEDDVSDGRAAGG